MMNSFFELPENLDKYELFYVKVIRSILLLTAGVSFVAPFIFEIIDYVTQTNGNKLSDVIITFIVAILSFLLFIALKKGYINQATMGFVAILYLSTSVLIYFGNGVSDPIIAAYFLVIIVSGLVLERKYPLIMSGLAIVAMIFFYMAETNGWVIYSPERIAPSSYLLIGSSVFMMVGFVLRFFVTISRQKDEEIRQSNEQLQNLNQNLEGLVQERTRVLEQTVEIGRQLTSILDSDQLVVEMVERIKQSFGYYHVHVYLADEKNNSLQMVAGSGEPGRVMLERNHKLAFNQGLVGQAATTKKPVLISDVTQEINWLPNPLLPETASEVAVPILLGTELLGVLDVQNNIQSSLTQSDVSVLQVLSNQMGVALRNARNFSQIRFQAQNEAVINEISSNIQQVEDIESVFKAVAVKVNEVLDLNQMLLQVGSLDKRAYENSFEVPGQYAMPPKGVDEWGDFLDGVHLPVCISYRENNEQKKMSQSNALTSDIEVPLTVRNKSIGYMGLTVENGRMLTSSEEEMVSQIAEVVAQRADNLRLLAMTERYRQEAEAASRRLTQQAWDKAISESPQTGYAFDLNEVTPINGAQAQQEDASTFTQAIEISGQTIGQLEIEDMSSLSSNEVSLVTAVSKQFGNHLENLRLTEQMENALVETEIYSTQLRQLNELSTQINSLTSSDEIMQLVVSRCVQILGADRVSITLIDPNQPDELVVAAFDGIVQNSSVGARMQLADSPMETAINNNHIEVGVFGADDEELSARFIPLYVLGKVSGTLNLARRFENKFSSQDDQLLNQIASLTGSALESSNLLEQNRTALKETETLYEIVSRLNKSTTNKELLDAMLSNTFVGGFARATFNQIEVDHNNVPITLTVSELETDRTQDSSPFKIGHQFVGDNMPFKPLWMASPFEVLIVDDVRNDPRIDENDKRLMEIAEDRAMVVIPLNVRGYWLGIVHIVWEEKIETSQFDRRLLNTIAEQASTVTNQLRLFDEAKTRANLLAQLSEIEHLLSQAISENDTLDAVLQVCDQPDSMTLFHFGNDELGNPAFFQEVAHWQNGQYEKPYANPIELTETHPVFNEWLEDPTQIIWVEDVSTYTGMDEVARQSYVERNTQTFLLMPLVSLGRWQGALEVNWKQAHSFTENEKFLLKQVIEAISANIASRRAAQDTQRLYQVSERLNQADTFVDVLKIFSQYSDLGIAADVSVLAYFNQPWTKHEKPRWAEIVGQMTDGMESAPHSNRFLLPEFPDLEQLKPDKPLIIEDIVETPNLNETSRQFLSQTGRSKSAMFFPLVVGNNWFGYVAFFYFERKEMYWSQIQQLFNLVEQASVAIQAIRFLQNVELRAAREQQIRQIATKVRNSTSVEAILKTAAEEMGKVLGRHSVVYLDANEKEK